MEPQNRLERYVSAERAANNIMMSLGLDSADRGMIYMWMFECATNVVNMPASWEKTVIEIPVEECQAKKPCDHVKTLQVYIKDCNGNCVRVWYEPFQPVHRLNYGSPTKQIIFSSKAYNVSEQTHHYDISSNANGNTFVLEYLRYMFDETGNILIDRIWLPALESYVRYKHIRRIVTQGSNRFSEGNVRAAKEEFNAFVQQAKGRMAQALITNDAKDQIASKWNDIYYTPMNPYLRRQLGYNYATHSEAITYLRGNNIIPPVIGGFIW